MKWDESTRQLSARIKIFFSCSLASLAGELRNPAALEIRKKRIGKISGVGNPEVCFCSKKKRMHKKLSFYRGKYVHYFFGELRVGRGEMEMERDSEREREGKDREWVDMEMGIDGDV